MLSRTEKLALYMEGALGSDYGKMGYGVLRYSPNPVVCVIDSAHAGKNVQDVIDTPRNCPVVSNVEEAVARGSQAMVLGIAPSGGLIPAEWYADIDSAVSHGLSIINGLHDQLAIRYQGLQEGQFIWDIRIEPSDLAPGLGQARLLTNKRLLMIGTDMAVGKMTAGLEIHKMAVDRGMKAEFIATGQIGITITGRGVPLDAVRVDYACGAIEREVLAAKDAELVVIEGQGALLHPGSTATLPLMRGSCPTHFVLCVRAGQKGLRRIPEILIPPLRDYIKLYEDLGETCGAFARPKTIGIAVNTSHLNDDEAMAEVSRIEAETGFPTMDPVRHGCERINDALG